jgi:four helix bundle protein
VRRRENVMEFSDFRRSFRKANRCERGTRLAVRDDMSRNYKELRVFQAADALVTDVYILTNSFPIEERYGLRSQVRRAATSVPTNIVEGSVRRSERYWVNYLETALGSACEARYLLEISIRLEFLDPSKTATICDRYSQLIAGLQAMIVSMPAGNSRT